MSFREALFWVAVTILGTGLYFVIDALRKGTKKKISWIMLIAGLVAAFLLYPYRKPTVTGLASAQGQSQSQNKQQSSGANSPNVIQNGNGNVIQNGNGNRVTINSNTPAVLPQPTFRETKSDSVSFSLGNGDTAVETMEDLRNGPRTPFRLNGYAPVVLRAKGSILFYDVTMWGGTGKSPIEVKDNQFTVRVPDWDWNSSPNAFEVVNENGVPIFQLIRKKPNHFVVNGIFPLPRGAVVVAGPKGTIGPAGRVPPDFALKPIFKYPSWEYPGRYADSSAAASLFPVPAPSPPFLTLRFFRNGGEPRFSIANVGDAAGIRPKWTIALADYTNEYYPHYLDDPDSSEPLPIPTNEIDDFVKGHSFSGNFEIFNQRTLQLVKAGDKIFGLIGIGCLNCPQDSKFWFYWEVGEGGWYAPFIPIPSGVGVFKQPNLSGDQADSLIMKIVPAPSRVGIIQGQGASVDLTQP